MHSRDQTQDSSTCRGGMRDEIAKVAAEAARLPASGGRPWSALGRVLAAPAGVEVAALAAACGRLPRSRGGDDTAGFVRLLESCRMIPGGACAAVSVGGDRRWPVTCLLSGLVAAGCAAAWAASAGDWCKEVRRCFASHVWRPSAKAAVRPVRFPDSEQPASITKHVLRQPCSVFCGFRFAHSVSDLACRAKKRYAETACALASLPSKPMTTRADFRQVVGVPHKLLGRELCAHAPHMHTLSLIGFSCPFVPR